MQQVRQGGQRTASTIGAGVFFLPALPVTPCVWIPEAAWATEGSGAASADGCQEGSHRGHCTCAAGVEGHGEALRTAHVGERCQMKCTAVVLVSAGRSSTLCVSARGSTDRGLGRLTENKATTGRGVATALGLGLRRIWRICSPAQLLRANPPLFLLTLGLLFLVTMLLLLRTCLALLEERVVIILVGVPTANELLLDPGSLLFAAVHFFYLNADAVADLVEISSILLLGTVLLEELVEELWRNLLLNRGFAKGIESKLCGVKEERGVGRHHH